ncbi:unnamed protein product [Prorocentrum cordatum]|uniref:Uncharacterized protein n=1 Tax=Prorocentrum cordatum TaxID=2364126 RepID=A0ABN9T0X0_9DINO|nr:unnamed protein product [Polarella glacialis]
MYSRALLRGRSSARERSLYIGSGQLSPPYHFTPKGLRSPRCDAHSSEAIRFFLALARRGELGRVLGPVSGGLRGSSHSDDQQTLRGVADALMNQWDLYIGGVAHSIVELEAYVHSTAHPDPYTHGEEGQGSCGAWYFHRQGRSFKGGSFKGLDLACGCARSGVFAGLLLRAVSAGPGKLVEGPSLVVDHILPTPDQRQGQRRGLRGLSIRRRAPRLQHRGPALGAGEAPPRRQGPVRAAGRPRAARGGGRRHALGGQSGGLLREGLPFSTAPARLGKWRCGFAAAARLQGDAEALGELGLPAARLAAYLGAVDRGLAHGDPAAFVDKKAGHPGRAL